MSDDIGPLVERLRVATEDELFSCLVAAATEAERRGWAPLRKGTKGRMIDLASIGAHESAALLLVPQHLAAHERLTVIQAGVEPVGSGEAWRVALYFRGYGGVTSGWCKTLPGAIAAASLLAHQAREGAST